MRRIAIILATATALLSGCNVGGGALAPTSSSTASPTSPASNPTPQIQPISGNWQFSTTSTMGRPSTKISGGIAESGGSVTGGVRVDGSTCFNNLTTISLAGTLMGTDLNLSAALEGQVIALTGTVTTNAITDIDSFAGTYTITGGCADGDKGSVTGINIYIDDAMDGTFTTSQQQTFAVSGGLDMYVNPNPDGSFGVVGNATFGFCVGSATVMPGTLSSGSFIMGTNVGLEFQSNNGIVTFTGTLDLGSYDADYDSYQINGNYTVSGSTCDGTGTAELRVYNPWDY